MRFLLMLALLLTPIIVSAQQSQQRRIDVPATARWQHARSGIVLPRQIDTLPRNGIVENVPGEVDVMANYEDSATRVSIFLFRPQQNDVGVWFDRAIAVLPANPMLAGLTPLTAEPQRFAPVAGGVESGLRRSYGSTGRWTSTSVALFPVGRWLVAVRASSSSLDVAAINALVDEALTVVQLPASAPVAVPVRVIADCPTPMQWRNARAQRPSMADALLGATLLSMADAAASGGDGNETAPAEAQPTDDASASGLASADLCRDATVLPIGSVYRIPSQPQSYWIALGDSGSVVSVGPFGMSLDGSNDEPPITELLLTPTQSMIFSRFNRLPSPQQAIDELSRSAPIAASSFDPERGTGNNITIGTGR